MPTYEYLCPAGHGFEKFQKITDRPRQRCPVCGKMAERKISGGAGLVFKGSGFYITDYGKAGKGPAKPPDASGGEARPETRPDQPSKPAASEKKPGKRSGSSGEA